MGRLSFVAGFTAVAIFLAGGNAAWTQSFPTFAPGSNIYTITQNDETLIIDTLYLPKNSRIVVDPKVTAINWVVDKIKIDGSATIDLSASQSPPPKAASGGQPAGQQGYCTPGNAGQSGSNGLPGLPAASLNIHGISNITNTGWLWIKADGGPGTDGGDGGDGQQGGGRRSTFGPGLFHGGGCAAAGGGSGGRGGRGGAGGAPGKVTISLKSDPGNAIANPIEDGCGSSSPPTTALGTIGITARAGCRGKDGRDGKDGKGG
jgi:hypothetical protein